MNTKREVSEYQASGLQNNNLLQWLKVQLCNNNNGLNKVRKCRFIHTHLDKHTLYTYLYTVFLKNHSCTY